MKKKQIEKNDHVQLGGLATYYNRNFMFSPDNPVAEQVETYNGLCHIQTLSDGTVECIAKPKKKSESRLIRKLAHGRVSETKDGAIQLTIKVFLNENLNVGNAILDEALDGVMAVRKDQEAYELP